MPMGLNTTTFNVDELITSYADNQIQDHETVQQIEELLNKDQKLNAKFRAEIMTRDLLRKRLPEVELPAVTYAKVMTSIEGLIEASKKKYNASGALNSSKHKATLHSCNHLKKHSLKNLLECRVTHLP